jgi:hypothetical protein
MAQRRGKNPKLVDRDYDILDHVSRYRLSTREVLHRLYFNEAEMNAVTKVTSRLVDYGFLNRFELHSGKSYFVFGPEGAKLFGISPKKCRPLGPQSLICEYAILQFCCLSQDTRERLLVRELAAKLPNLTGKHLRAGYYYLDHNGERPRLSAMRVDHGADSAHIVRKARADLESLILNPAIRGLVETQRFMMAILTVTEQKVQDIQDSLLRHSWPIPFRVEAVPDLAPLMGRRPEANDFEGAL